MLLADNGAVFWMDPNNAPAVDPANPSAWQAVLAQITVRDGVTWSATVNARGKLAGTLRAPPHTALTAKSSGNYTIKHSHW